MLPDYKQSRLFFLFKSQADAYQQVVVSKHSNLPKLEKGWNLDLKKGQELIKEIEILDPTQKCSCKVKTKNWIKFTFMLF